MILQYYNGNYEFCLFLLDIIYDTSYGSNILDKKCLRTSIVGAISNILIATEDVLIDRDKGTSRIPLKVFEEGVEMIASYKDGKYVIDGYSFVSKEVLAMEIRNKIAHGNFDLDLEYNRIILRMDDGSRIRINIDKLSRYIIFGFNAFLKIAGNEYVRDVIILDKGFKDRNKLIRSEKELKGFLQKFKKIEFFLKRRDGGNIEPCVKDELERVIFDYRNNMNLNTLFRFRDKWRDRYDFSWDIRSLKNISDDLVRGILNTMREDITYEEEVYYAGFELQRYLDSKYEKVNPIMANLRNIILLDYMEKYDTKNVSYLSRMIGKEYKSYFWISYDNLASVGMAMFNSLFSYANDNFYVNKNGYDDVCDGLPYEKLDLSLLEVDKICIDTSEIDLLEEDIKGVKSSIKGKDKIINKQIGNLSKVKDNEEVKEKITSVILNINKQKGILVNELNSKSNLLSKIKLFYQNNNDYLIKKRVISGIRNSIAHGNYRVIFNDSMEDSIILFEDIYKGEITFRGRIRIIDFIKLISDNYSIVNGFIMKSLKVVK